MNVTVENLGPCKKLVRIEVDAQTVDAAFEKTTTEFQREARLPGFRPGKTPRQVVAKTFAKRIDEETKRQLISENYRKAVSDQKLRVIGYPDIEEIQFGRGQPLQFAATLETAPEFELPEYNGIVVRRETATVTEADIERALTVLREQRASYRTVNRQAQTDDYVVVKYTATSEGRPLTDIAPTARGLTQQDKFWLHIKEGSFIPGFTEQLIGAQAGEHRTVKVEFPAEFVAPQLAGKQGIYEVDLLEVKERVLPDLNDELARHYGAEDVAKLREGVRGDLQNELKYKQSKSVRNQLVRALLDRVDFELPESVVLSETRNVVYDIVRENAQRGVSKEAIDQQREEIFSLASHSAKDRIKASFLLGRIAEKENIKVEEREIAEHIHALARQHQIRPEKLIKQLEERNGIAEIHERILSSKVLDFLELHARVEEVQLLPPGQ